jgi:pantothenate kinase-related protein Tda10
VGQPKRQEDGQFSTNTMAAQIIDDKSEHCIPFLLERLKVHREGDDGGRPFFLGLNGVQGAGKTTLVSIAECFQFQLPSMSICSPAKFQKSGQIWESK